MDKCNAGGPSMSQGHHPHQYGNGYNINMYSVPPDSRNVAGPYSTSTPYAHGPYQPFRSRSRSGSFHSSLSVSASVSGSSVSETDRDEVHRQRHPYSHAPLPGSRAPHDRMDNLRRPDSRISYPGYPRVGGPESHGQYKEEEEEEEQEAYSASHPLHRSQPRRSFVRPPLLHDGELEAESEEGAGPPVLPAGHSHVRQSMQPPPNQRPLRSAPQTPKPLPASAAAPMANQRSEQPPPHKKIKLEVVDVDVDTVEKGLLAVVAAERSAEGAENDDDADADADADGEPDPDANADIGAEGGVVETIVAPASNENATGSAMNADVDGRRDGKEKRKRSGHSHRRRHGEERSMITLHPAGVEYDEYYRYHRQPPPSYSRELSHHGNGHRVQQLRNPNYPYAQPPRHISNPHSHSPRGYDRPSRRTHARGSPAAIRGDEGRDREGRSPRLVLELDSVPGRFVTFSSRGLF